MERKSPDIKILSVGFINFNYFYQKVIVQSTILTLIDLNSFIILSGEYE
jgi:hypothetical protein